MNPPDINPISRGDLHSWIRDRVTNHDGVLTPRELGLMIRHEQGVDRKEAKTLIHDVVCDGSLEYLDMYGRTCLAPSFSRPVRMAPRVFIKPPECHVDSQENDIVIELHKGIAFGRGAHPTTKLCIRALNYLFDTYQPTIHSALDIGTGNGILCVAAAKFGSHTVDACDIDGIAVHEARENAKLNNLDSIIRVSSSCDFSIPRQLIMANLRYPTLISMHQVITDALTPKSFLVLSGIKISEIQRIKFVYGKTLELIWSDTDAGWMSLMYHHP